MLSSYRFEFWVPIELHLLGMHIIILSLNGALPLYNTILAYVLHELSKAQLSMLLSLCAPALLLYCMYAYITYCITPIFRVEEIFAIFANLDFARNFPPAKIISTANGISRNFPPAKFSSREIFLPAKIKI